MADPVNCPEHYNQGRIEVIDVIASHLDSDKYTGFEGFLLGNVLKYILRFKYKGGNQDLLKARFYLERLVEYNSKEK